MEDVLQFNAIDGRIDSDEGVIKDVSLITMGDARGHGLEVDDVTLAQLKTSMEAASSPGIKAKLNHRSGVEAVFGYINNFSIQGNKLKGDLNLLKHHKDYAQTMEQIATMPGQIGLSVAFQGDKEAKGGKTLARCKRIISVDLVADPAANPDGMFETKVDNNNYNMNEPDTDQQDVAELLGAINDRLSGLENFQGDLEEAISDNLSDDSYEEDSYEDDSYEEAEYEDEGEYEDADLEPAYEGEPEQYESINDALTYLESKAEGALAAEQEISEQAIMDEVEMKFEELMAENQELKFENENLQDAIEMGGVEALPSSAVEHLFGTPSEEGSFQFSIQQASLDSNDPNEAIRSAVNDNPRAHTEWLHSSGVYGN
jgi:hypothetical protein